MVKVVFHSSWFNATLPAAIFVVALFFIGVNVDLLCLALFLLSVWTASVAWRSHPTGLQVPRSSLAGAMLVYPLWLALSIAWSQVPAISHLTFWWVATGAVTYWLFVLDPRREEVWPRAALLILLASLGLAVFGYYQRYVLDEVPSGPFLDRNLYAALLILVAFPVAARFLTVAGRRLQVGACAAFAMLVFAVALSQSRAGMVTVVAAAVVFATVAWRPQRKARLGILGLVVLGAFLLANISLGGGVAERLATLQHPYESGHTRFLIWEGTWRMILERPWLGIGLGVYPLLWPPFRHAEDSSAGYFAHNDYLQAWVDTGLPGLVLLLALLLAATWTVWRLWRRTEAGSDTCAELAGLAAAFVALPVNSLFNYNFYVIPSLMVFGMVLARVQMLHDAAHPRLTLPVARAVGRPAWRALVLLVVLLPVSYFASVAGAEWLTQRAIDEANRGDYQAADRHFAQAHKLWPSADAVLLRHAELYHHVLGTSRSMGEERRTKLFDATRRMLDEAARLNPLRADIHVARAELLRANAQMDDARGFRAEIEQAYRRGLELDPWHFRARYRFAGYLLTLREIEPARAVLEEGNERAFSVSYDSVVPYLLLTAKLREAGGDETGAAKLRRRAESLAADKEQARLRRAKREELPFHWRLLALF